MRPLTVEQVRDLLSSAAASTFFEAWGRVESERVNAQAELDDLTHQISVSEARVGAAEALAAEASRLAEEAQRRLLQAATAPELRPFIACESEALARAHTSRAAQALDEASERRRRAVQLREHAERLRALLATDGEKRARLRAGAAELGGYVGEACLFFADAERAGGSFVVPLQTLQIGQIELPAFVLHRLSANAPLEAAQPLRDAQPAGLDEDPQEFDPETDPFQTPSERQKTTGRKRKKEKS